MTGIHKWPRREAGSFAKRNKAGSGQRARFRLCLSHGDASGVECVLHGLARRKRQLLRGRDLDRRAR